jgi:hypothetical protein
MQKSMLRARILVCRVVYTTFYGVQKWLTPKVNYVQSKFHPEFALKRTIVFFFSDKLGLRVWTHQEYLG